MTRYDQPVFVSWNGVEKEYNLNQPKVPNVLIETPLDIPLIYKLPFIIAFCVSCGFIIFSLLVILGTWHPQRRQKKHPPNMPGCCICCRWLRFGGSRCWFSGRG
jgi:hypothetical protein